MGACLSDQELASYVDGSASSEQVAAWKEHLTTCDNACPFDSSSISPLRVDVGRPRAFQLQVVPFGCRAALSRKPISTRCIVRVDGLQPRRRIDAVDHTLLSASAPDLDRV